MLATWTTTDVGGSWRRNVTGSRKQAAVLSAKSEVSFYFLLALMCLMALEDLVPSFGCSLPQAKALGC